MHGRRLVESVMYGGSHVPTSKKTHNTTVLSCCVVGFLDVGPVLGLRSLRFVVSTSTTQQFHFVVLPKNPQHNNLQEAQLSPSDRAMRRVN